MDRLPLAKDTVLCPATDAIRCAWAGWGGAALRVGPAGDAGTRPATTLAAERLEALEFALC